MASDSEAIVIIQRGDRMYIGGYVDLDGYDYASIVILGRSSFSYQDHIAMLAPGYKYSRLSTDENGGDRVTAACAVSSTDTLISVHYMNNSQTFNTTYFAV